MMSTEPEVLWSTLPPTLRRQIVGDLAAVLAEVFYDVRVDPADASEAQGRRLYPAVNTALGREQSGEPAAPVRASPARL